jgi:UDP-N-acetyl-D-glucosamine dehydrogenase
MKNETISRIQSREITIGVIGMGYVGLPLALNFVESGFSVIGFDIDETKSESISAGKSYFSHIPSKRINDAVNDGFSVTNDMSRSAEADALVICVPTPLGKHKEPDLSFVRASLDSLKSFIRPGHIISLESTTYPGTTEEEIVKPLQELGFVVGVDLFVVYSPEREDPGNVSFDTKTIPKVVGGHTCHCLEVGTALYGQAIDTIVPVSSTRTAEMTKLLENIYRAVNIGLVNELKIVSEKMDIDIFEVIDAASSKPFGFSPFYPGPGLGGHCIPIDPFYLTWKAREFGVNTRFIELAGEINTSMPARVLGKVEDALNRHSKALKGSDVLVIGVAYKKDSNDTRESPGIKIMSLLESKGANVSYHDPYVPKIPKLRDYDMVGESVDLAYEIVSSQDCLVICTDHSLIDFQMVASAAKLVIDTRNTLPAKNANVVTA